MKIRITDKAGLYIVSGLAIAYGAFIVVVTGWVLVEIVKSVGAA